MRNLILITRPEGEAEFLSGIVAKTGFASLLEPLLSIETVCAVWPVPAGFSGLVVTSANAVSFVPEEWTGSGLPAYAVGDATAERARRVGFANVVSASGDAAALETMLAAQFWPDGARLLHARGADVAQELYVPGVGIEPLTVYKAAARGQFSETALRGLDDGRIAAVLLYSPRSGAVFADLVAKQGRTPCLRGINALCLSAAVVQSVGHLPWAGVRQAERPDQAAMLRLIAECIPEAGSIDGR
jgi:uroporphyrinogen-III synthase